MSSIWPRQNSLCYTVNSFKHQGRIKITGFGVLKTSGQSDDLYIPIILGTAREGRESEKVAKFVLEEAIKYGLKNTEIIDVRDFRIKATDKTLTLPEAKKLSQKIKKADGLIIVTPEYNHGCPGELKMMLDMLYKDYFQKPVGFCGVSSGALGGARVVEQLRLVCIELRMVPIREAMYFPTIEELFDENGAIKDESFHDQVRKFLDELLWYAKALKPAREIKTR
jgi:NAD(P)H-dependent FMN reductase